MQIRLFLRKRIYGLARTCGPGLSRPTYSELFIFNRMLKTRLNVSDLI